MSYPVQSAPAYTSPHIWGSADYLLWWVKNQNLSTPVVTTSSNPAAMVGGINVAGGLGRDGTSVFVGNKGLDYGAQSGGRLTIGGFLDSEGTFGVEGRGFLMQQGSVHRSITSDAGGNPLIALPIVDVAGGSGENSIFVSDPGLARGSALVIARTQLWGLEFNGLMNMSRSEGFSLDILGGFRYANLRESVAIITSTTSLPGSGGVAFLGGFTDPGTTTTADTFKTRNQFYGGQLGARGEAEFGSFFGSITGKLAMGSTHQVVDIRGLSTLTNAAGVTTAATGGVYALPSNIGVRSHNAFSVIPEVELKLGYKVTDNIRGYVGYNFMYWSDVVRAGEQIDRSVDVRRVPTAANFVPGAGVSPSAQFSNTGFWAQGINFGIELRY